MSTPPAPLLVVLGPTACGKEAAALHAASSLDGEVVCCDSVKPYRGLAITSSAPTEAVRSAVPHHLAGVLDPAERLNAARWLALAESAFREIRGRGRTPLVVGGTSLYLKTLLHGLFEGPPADHALRERLIAAEEAAPGALHERLTAADPVAAGRIHPNDRKRLLRALEVVAATGSPISERQTQWEADARRDARIVGLRRSREDLRARIAARVAAMVEEGLLDEIRSLLPEGVLGPTAREAIGVKEIVPVLESERAAGELDPSALAAALEAVRNHTWQLARRQMTWFKRFEGVVWLDVSPEEPPEVTGARIVDCFRDAGGSPTVT